MTTSIADSRSEWNIECDYLFALVLSDPPSGVTLADLLATVRPTVAELATVPESARVVVRGTVIDDPNDPLPLTPGGLLLLVGASPDRPAASQSLRRAAESGFAGVVVKRRGCDFEALASQARVAGLALVVIADEIPWRHLDASLSSAISSGSRDHEDPAARGDELFSIANAVAEVVGGAVAIEDLAQHVLAYSSIPGQRIDPLRRQGILDRRVPRGPHDPELYRRVLAADGIVRFPQLDEDLPRSAIAIRAGTLPLGTLWAIEEEAGVSPQAERALLDGASLAAVHMLRARDALDLDRLRRDAVLSRLLDGTGSPEAAWPRLGFGAGDRISLMALAPTWSPDATDAPLITHLAQEVNRTCRILRPDAPIGTSARSVYVLIAGGHAGEAASRLAHRIVPDISRALAGRVYAAVSSELTGPRSIPRLRDEVDQILRVNAGGTSAPTIATMADVQSTVMLLHISDEIERHPELRHPALVRLAEHDERRGTTLAASLLAWLEAQQNVPTAAERLHVHPNTLRYRLRRVREIAPIDLDDADERLVVWLELRLSRQHPTDSARHDS